MFFRYMFLGLFSAKLIAFADFYENDENRLSVIERFLPFNPVILLSADTEKSCKICKQFWPMGSILSLDSEIRNSNIKCDFLWIEDSDQILYKEPHFLHEVSVIHTMYSKEIVSFLEQFEWTLYHHWSMAGKNQQALFVKKPIFDAVMRSLNYSSKGVTTPPYAASSCNLERFFRPAVGKIEQHNMDQIDFIYMINLDERPEKYMEAVEHLHLYGIDPYRFSAVNGWKLPFEIFDQVGVKFPLGSLQEKFMGAVYRKADTFEYTSNELIREGTDAYFCLGITRGHVGIVLSHLSVLQDAYDSGYHTIWVMEDDVDVVSDPSKIPNLIRNLDNLVPDWDVLFTDVDTKDPKGQYVLCRSLAARPNFNVRPLASFLQNFYSLNQDFSRTGMRYGAYSMIIRRSGVKKILEYFKTYRIFLPYDMDYWLIPDLKMYCVRKDIISHKPGAHSDNRKPGYNNPKD